MTTIIQYNAGNIQSVANALQRLGQPYVITDDPEIIRLADKVILPGVGAAGPAMQYLKEKGLDRLILSLTQPVLGICLGMQLMCRYSEEDATECLGIFDVPVQRFPALAPVPHMGWNSLAQLKGDLFKDITEQDDLYFVHSYYAGLHEATTGVCDYILPFSAALQYRNFYALQFHPEKSAGTGEQILNNFLSL